MGVLTVIEVSGDLTAARRSALAAELAQAGGAVLLRIASAGLPEAELGVAAAVAEVAALCEAIENRTAAVVAVLSGQVRGAALELALAAGARVARQGAAFGFSDAGLGLVPGAGATQRLPRLVGAAEALRMLQDGAEVDAVTAFATGLVDALAEGDGVQDAVRLAGALPLRKGIRDGRAYLATVAAARGAARTPAQARIVDCVEAALMLPHGPGLAFERVTFEDLCASAETQGLLHARRAFAVAADAAVPVARLGIWGAAAPAVGLAVAALRAGLEVQLAAESREAVVKALADVAERQEAEVQAGRMLPEAREAEWARLLPQVGAAGLAGVDLTVMTEAGAVAGPRLAYGVALADVPVLTRFESLAEIAANGAAPDHVARGAGLARALGWVPVVTRQGGPVVLRLATALAEAVAWVEAQAAAQDAGRGVGRAALAQSLAAQGIAGEGAARAGVADGIALRCLAALANEGARLVGEGIAPSAAHVDAVAIAAGLMARWTGGPMHQANRRGLMVLRRDLRGWAADDAALWTPAPLIDALIAEGRGFT
ncbi:enoyl-CoA hydratase-related protein [Paragemmobacter straminiformis]|uniref:3-hydroxyacyl-CoA dehydrogenase n=1 Tax=Paragemmobacter straminiformis TaxID=2045119 RepID=A0A842I892_9RHOB|nr:enoyl-CoA hydratase-related protein [Gemmobacter straminiformis]MBC2835208.1 hypothetical protein [Gemmobacter straminiformis]